MHGFKYFDERDLLGFVDGTENPTGSRGARRSSPVGDEDPSFSGGLASCRFRQRWHHLNQWAARELNAKPGDTVTLDYFVWKPDGRLHTESAQFPLARIVPIDGAAPTAISRPIIRASPSRTASTIGIRRFPSISSASVPIDEQYWKQYRTTPKAFMPLARGQQFWGTRFGKLTSIRISPPVARLWRRASRRARSERMGV